MQLIPTVRHSHLASACALALTLTATATAFAADHDVTELGTVTVTGQMPRSSLTWETDPSTADAFSGTDAADFLQTVPGVNRLRNGGTNSDPVLRGQFGSRLNLITNDAHMSGACPARMDNALSYITPESFDTLRVIKGPQSVIWGPGGSAGTVIFRRELRPLEGNTTTANLSALVGSNDRHDVAAHALLGNRKFYVRADAQQSRSDDYRDGDGAIVPSRWDKYGADVALGWTPSEQTQIELQAGTGDGLARYAGRGMDGTQFRRESHGLRARHAFTDGALKTIEFEWARNGADHIMDNHTLRTPNPNSSMPMPMTSNVRSISNSARLLTTWQWQHSELQIGADASRMDHDQRNSMGSMDVRSLPYEQDAQFANTGVFAEWSRTQDKNRWIAGARVDRAQVTDRRLTTGSMMPMPNPTANVTRRETLPAGFLRLEHKLSATTTTYAGIGHTARMPDYWELISPAMGPAGSKNAFAGVQPERTTQLDIGAQRRTRNGQQWISAYAGTQHDYILTDYLQGGMMGTTTRTRNVNTRIAGAELGFRQQVHATVRLTGSLATAYGHNRTDNTPLPQMPPLDARFGLDWTPNARTTLGLQLRGVAAQHRIALNEGNIVGRDLGPSNGFGTVAINTTHRLTDRVQLSAGIDNLFDRSYSEHLNLAGSADFGFPADPVRINEPGRTWWLRLRIGG